MTFKTAIAAAFISLSTLAAVPAQASDFTIKIGFGAPGYGWGGGYHQYHKPSWNRTLTPWQVRWMLQREGYRNIAYFDRRGSVYQARATQHGRTYFLIISASNGRVIERTRV